MPPKEARAGPSSSSEDAEESRAPPHGMVCRLGEMPSNHNGQDASKDLGPDGGRLSLMHGGWCGPMRDGNVPTSCARKVQAFLTARPAVLHIDEVLNNKKDPQQVRYLLQRLIKQRVPVQVAFLQGTLPLQQQDTFPRLLNFLLQCPVWSVNLGGERRRGGSNPPQAARCVLRRRGGSRARATPPRPPWQSCASRRPSARSSRTRCASRA